MYPLRRLAPVLLAVVVPVLPSALDIEAIVGFLNSLAQNPRVHSRKLPAGLVLNRTKPWTQTSQQALQMLTSGQALSPQKAKSLGLIHEIAEPAKLVEAAKAMIKNGLKPVAPWDEKGFRLPGGPIYWAAGANLWPPAIAILRRETYGNYPAAAAILKCD